MRRKEFVRILAEDFTPRTAADFFAFCKARELVRIKKDRGDPPPWTDDPHLSAWRFCNVFREDDKTTRWFRSNIRDPLRDQPLKVLAATLIFRRFNRIEVGEAIKAQLTHDQDLDAIEDALRPLWHGGEHLFTGAFMVRSPNGYDKLTGTMLALRETVPLMARMPTDSMQHAHEFLATLPMLGGFQANQIVADLRFTRVLEHAPDLRTWACAGPGTMRGLGWLHGVLRNRLMADGQAWARERMAELSALAPEYGFDMPVIDVSHALCEADKMWRCSLLGEQQKRRFDAEASYRASPH